MIRLLATPGFFGTKAPLRSDITLVVMLVSAALFTLGWQLAVRRRYTAHRWVQTTAATLSACGVLFTMVGSFATYILPGLPAQLTEGSYGITTLHALIGAVSLVLGMFVTLRGNGLVPKRLRFTNYKLFMRAAYVLYMVSTLVGVAVYVIVYMYGI